MLALRNVSTTMLTTAKDVHKHAAAVLKNVEGWLGNRTTLIFLIFLELLFSLLELLPPPPPPPYHQMYWAF
jgi:hypothetical protein